MLDVTSYERLEGKLTCAFKNDMRHLANFCQITLKSQNQDFDGILLSKLTNVSSNINEAIKTTLNSFIQKLRNHKKAQNAYKRTKIKMLLKKHLTGKQSLIHLFAFLCFCQSVFMPFSAISAFSAFQCFQCVRNLFVKKNKKFKTAFITSFISLLNSSYHKHEFFNHYSLF